MKQRTAQLNKKHSIFPINIQLRSKPSQTHQKEMPPKKAAPAAVAPARATRAAAPAPAPQVTKKVAKVADKVAAKAPAATAARGRNAAPAVNHAYLITLVFK